MFIFVQVAFKRIFSNQEKREFFFFFNLKYSLKILIKDYVEVRILNV